MIKITVNGTPIAKARPRFFRKKNFVGTYNPQETEEGRFLAEAIVQVRAQIDKPLSGPLCLYLCCLFRRPKSHYGTGKNSGKLKPSAPKFCTNKKDFDNLAKFYTDALNGIAYIDDKQIINATIDKQYADFDEEEHILIMVREVDNG